MIIKVPCRGELIAQIPLFIKAQPLQRPRLNRHSKSIYQPKKNQAFLYDELSKHIPEVPFNHPCIIDTYANFEHLNKKNPHPTAPEFGDEDNLRKGLNDALVGLNFLEDDKLVVGGENFKAFSTEDVILVRIYSVSDEIGQLVMQ